MTRTVPDRQRRTGPATERAGPADAITRVLSRQVKTGHEQAFEAVLRGLAAEVSCQPGHLDATVLKPRPGGPPSCTIASYPARCQDADAWPSSKIQARLVAEAKVRSGDARRRSTYPDWRADWPRPAPRCWSRQRAEDPVGLRGRDRAAAGNWPAIALPRGYRRFPWGPAPWSSS